MAPASRCYAGGTADNPTPWIAPEHTDPFHHWFWPLGGTITDEGTIALFVAEFHERGSRYLSHSEPVATWVATIDPATMTPIARTGTRSRDRVVRVVGRLRH